MLTNQKHDIKFFSPYLLKLDLQYFAEPNDPQPEPQEPQPQDPQPKVYDEAYVKKLRDEAAKYRTKAKDLEGQTQTQQQELLKQVLGALGIDPDPNQEFEKQLSAAQEAQKKANDKLIRAELKYVGSELGLVDMDVAYLLLDKEAISVGDDGSVEGMKEALEQVISAKPYLVKNVEPQSPNHYQAGPNQKGNPDPPKPDPYETGKQRALARHKKEEN
ncbi:hypothetical protein P8864_10375 [Priestia flexa]|uniref:phage scaffolding protein n=1 Tax=Priestia flexa TaxID=86664 RepID=UPI000C2514B7|nr:hypothetical protein [Priestia flexa]MEC0666294.1 hypothetical protein [Priestia flexa]